MKTLTREQITEKFNASLKRLLKKYNAELSAEDHYQGYPECGEDVRMTVSIPAIYSEDGDTVREHTDIDLGRLVTHD